MNKVFLVHDSRGQNNWGCRATTTALISLIMETGATVVGTIGHAPHIDFTGRAGLQRLARDAVANVPGGRRLSHRANVAWQRARGPANGFISSFDDFKRAAEAVDKRSLWPVEGDLMRSADTVIVNGEGSIYGRQLKGFIALFWAWYAKVCHGKSVALVNHGADLSHSEMRRAAEAVYPILDDVCFREAFSLRECRYAAPNAPEGVVPDAAYRFNPLPLEVTSSWASRPGFFSIWPYDAGSFDVTRPYIAVTGSSALNRPGSPDCSELTRQFARLCDGLQRIGIPLVLVAPDPTDAEFLLPVASERKLPILAPSTPLPIAHQVLAHAACLVGGRWHPGILAATGGTPLVSMTANTRKTAALREQLGLEGLVFDAMNLDRSIGAISEMTAEYVAEGEALRRRIRDRASVLREEARNNVRVLGGPVTATVPL